MKLIALKWIADLLPVGAAFEIPDTDRASAEALIVGGYAREAIEDPAPISRRSYRRRDLHAEDEA